MTLTAYLINGQAVRVELKQWSSRDLNGNPEFKIEETVSSGYKDVSSIENWSKFGKLAANDYQVIRDEILALQTWATNTNAEKDVIIKYCDRNVTDTDKVTYLMTVKGMTQPQAQGFLLETWHKHHKKFLYSCDERWYYAKKIVLTYLNESDGGDLFDTINDLANTYLTIGRKGQGYEDNKDGIMNYIESTYGFVGQGLAENIYTLQTGTWAEFISALKDCIINGIYNKYDG